MPGIFGFHINNKSALKAHELSRSMAQSLQYHDGQIVDTYYDEKNLLALGRVHLGVFNPISQPVMDKNKQFAVVFDGELYNRKELWELIKSDVKTDRKDDAFLLLYLWQMFGTKTFEKLDGQFSSVIADLKEQKLYLVSDRLGLKPVYYTLMEYGLIFSGEVKGILCDPRFDKSIDFTSLADLFTFGSVLGDKTLFSKIKLIPPSSFLLYDNISGTIKIEAYDSLANLFNIEFSKSNENTFEPACILFHNAVQKMTSNNGSLGMSLSAGLDSRSILAAAGNNAQNLKTYTLGVPGCSDQFGAAALAKIAGSKHEFLTLERSYFQSFLKNAEIMCKLTDGLYMPHEFTEMRVFEYLKEAGINILLRGHGGEIAKASLAWPFQVDQNLMHLQNKQEIIEFLYKKAGFVSIGLKRVLFIKTKAIRTSWEKLFTPIFYQKIKGRPLESITKACNNAIDFLSPGDLAIYLYIRESIRRQTIASLQIFRNYTEIRMPFLDLSFLKTLLCLNINKRLYADFHRQVIRKYRPSMIKVPDSNTGASLDASPLEEKIQEKIHLLLRIIGTKKHRHYTEFQKWFRRQHKEFMSDMIFDRKTLDRGYYEPHELKRIFDQHISGQYNYGYLLGTVLGIELWHREFVD